MHYQQSFDRCLNQIFDFLKSSLKCFISCVFPVMYSLFPYCNRIIIQSLINHSPSLGTTRSWRAGARFPGSARTLWSTPSRRRPKSSSSARRLLWAGSPARSHPEPAWSPFQHQESNQAGIAKCILITLRYSVSSCLKLMMIFVKSLKIVVVEYENEYQLKMKQEIIESINKSKSTTLSFIY